MPLLDPLLQRLAVVEERGLLPRMVIQPCRYPDGDHLPILLKVRLEEEVQEEPGFSRDRWGRICTELVGNAEEVDEQPFHRWG